MKYYVCFIGGTGARCCTSFIHSLFSGCAPDGYKEDSDPIHVLSIEADAACKDFQHSVEVASRYQAMRNAVPAGTEMLPMRAKIDYDSWMLGLGRNTLTALDLIKDGAGNMIPQGEQLLNTLFTDQQQHIDIVQGGFLANPNLGALFLQYALRNTPAHSPYDNFLNNILHDLLADQVKLILVGSLFGGTGASSFPSIVAAIRSAIDNAVRNGSPINPANFHTGAVMMMPYFLPAEAGGEIPDVARDFYASSNMGLMYYGEYCIPDGAGIKPQQLDTLYFLGTDKKYVRLVNAIPAAGAQWNPACYVDLEAAQSVLHFFSTAGTHGMLYTRKIDTIADGAGTQLRMQWSSIGYTASMIRKGLLGRERAITVPTSKQLAQGVFFALNILMCLYPSYLAWHGNRRAPGVYQAILMPYFAQNHTALQSLWEEARDLVTWFNEINTQPQMSTELVDRNDLNALNNYIPATMAMPDTYKQAYAAYDNQPQWIQDMCHNAGIRFKSNNAVFSALDNGNGAGDLAQNYFALLNKLYSVSL